ncbi:hypothetical protein COU62_01325 [Candidatus Pacearchaeota archaeon CG10_big_fil_rev_8_21_14_0_10_35_219]|nr:hypothetical protein [Candidatus Pacearchaeota archaeon]OIO43366.1 MAG: hypothetical protein AUJ63_00550 [Candidatus Pacearchaeota archaeon CG1_02_35_32]PIO08010.1 MAG: hypothetical protein COU62_01325 [Candidatus Pacearchaeota archaeon CG10_big_fil_rev_8_21_14_0_10_35_219]PIY81522.1 MAG: hypothetical protein COY79_02165 [Candidatus Pacearchaeota archaeon CG_4_10_14_0_8_um_filter_35_169]PIZ78897.1 MAG: hypothetical protein COY00_04550 [Candidatus Pacearchaeota archaeon CG_4_10_14_0_2_um_filt
MQIGQTDNGLLRALTEADICVIDDTLLHLSNRDLNFEDVYSASQRDKILREARAYSSLGAALNGSNVTFPQETINRFAHQVERYIFVASATEKNIAAKRKNLRRDAPNWIARDKYLADQQELNLQRKTHARAGRQVVRFIRQNRTETYFTDSKKDRADNIVNAIAVMAAERKIVRDLTVGYTKNDPEYRFMWDDPIIYGKALALAVLFPGRRVDLFTRDQDHLIIHKNFWGDVKAIAKENGLRVPGNTDLNVGFATEKGYFLWDKQGNVREIYEDSGLLLQSA